MMEYEEKVKEGEDETVKGDVVEDTNSRVE